MNLVPGLVAAPGRPSHPAAGGGFSLAGYPTSGPVPLLVRFNATYPNGTPPYLRWSFGDGTYLNGSGPSVRAPAHVYADAGAYVAAVTASWASGSLNASIPIRAVATALRAEVSAEPIRGPAPLSVFLNASPSGGTGTYVAFRWTFGDGANGSGLDLRYTYLSAGRFTATFTVEDSARESANASVAVNVSAANASNLTPPLNTSPGSHPSAPGAGTNPGWVVVGAVALAGIGGGSVLAVAVWRHRSRRAIAQGGPTEMEESFGPTEAVPFDRPTAHPGTDPGAPPVRPPAPPAADRPRRVGPTPYSVAPGDWGGALALRLVGHLAGLPSLGPGDVADERWTQAGLSAALGVQQSAVSRVLHRLVAAGVVEARSEHVAGASRKVRRYALTPRGERLGRALRETPDGGAREAG